MTSSDPSGDPAKEPKRSGFGGFLAELRRRKVVRVASVYVITGWVIIQVASSTFSNFGIPVWAFRFVALMVALGLPLAVILTWAFELTPDGIKTTKAAREKSVEGATNARHQSKRNWFSVAFAAAVPTLAHK